MRQNGAMRDPIPRKGTVMASQDSAAMLSPDARAGGSRSGESTPEQRLGEVETILAATYGRPRWRSSGPPLDELIATVLSQHTSDINTARAFGSLRSCFPHWSLVATAPVHEVVAAIRCGGLANIKAPRIREILSAVHGRQGGYDLPNLRVLSLGDARRWLESLPGVGPKTASCVLLFSLGRPAMPVDTHVHRVSRRLAIVGDAASPVETQHTLEFLIGPRRGAFYTLHMNLIRHGREVCRARTPRCTACALSSICPSSGTVA